MSLGVQTAHRVLAQIAGQLALWIARPKDPPEMNYGQMADDLQQVVNMLRDRAKETA